MFQTTNQIWFIKQLASLGGYHLVGWGDNYKILRANRVIFVEYDTFSDAKRLKGCNEKQWNVRILVICYSLLLKMAIEIISFPSYNGNFPLLSKR